jgi:hypothetical protein
MSTPLMVEGSIHFERKGRGAMKEIRIGPAPSKPEPGRVPRVARLMALAIRFDALVREGIVADYAELARLGHVTRARVTQMMNLLYLSPDIQEVILYLPRTERGRDPIVLRNLLPIAAHPDWKLQRRIWAKLRTGPANAIDSE